MTKRKQKRSGTLPELAELMNVARTTVYKWRKSGKLHGLIDADGRISDLDEAARVVPGRIKPKQQAAIRTRWKKTAEPSESEIQQYQALTNEELHELPIFELQRRNELEKLLLARLKRGEMEKTLIPADAVRRDAAECALLIKSTLESLPNRLSALLAAETDPDKIRKMLKTEMRAALTYIGTAL